MITIYVRGNNLNVTKRKIYNFLMAVLAVISIVLVILDYSSVLNLNTGVWLWVDNGILIIFAIDYFYPFV